VRRRCASLSCVVVVRRCRASFSASSSSGVVVVRRCRASFSASSSSGVVVVRRCCGFVSGCARVRWRNTRGRQTTFDNVTPTRADPSAHVAAAAAPSHASRRHLPRLRRQPAMQVGGKCRGCGGTQPCKSAAYVAAAAGHASRRHMARLRRHPAMRKAVAYATVAAVGAQADRSASGQPLAGHMRLHGSAYSCLAARTDTNSCSHSPCQGSTRPSAPVQVARSRSPFK